MGMLADPIQWYYRRYQKKCQASRVSFEGAPKCHFSGPKIQRISMIFKGKFFSTRFIIFLFLNNFLANIG